jgi:hypothetical protein
MSTLLELIAPAIVVSLNAVRELQALSPEGRLHFLLAGALGEF